MAKAEKILLTEPGVRLDMTAEEARQLKELLYRAATSTELYSIYSALGTAIVLPK